MIDRHMPAPKQRDYKLTISDNGIWNIDGENEDFLIENLNNDSDRAVALIAATILENRLERIILDRFIDDKKIVKKITEFQGLMGSFSAKIDLSYMLGIYSKPAYNEMNIIRRIRNEFAHDLSVVDFRTHKIFEKVKSLKLVHEYVADPETDSLGKPVKNGKVLVMKKPTEKPFMRFPSFSANIKNPRMKYLFTVQALVNAQIGSLGYRDGPIL